MAKAYTTSTWKVIPGCEDEFIALWKSFVDWIIEAYPGETSILLRDTQETSTFISARRWNSMEEIIRFRSDPKLERYKDLAAPLLEDLTSRNATEVYGASSLLV
jgi:heme-degrading monooxygenase HmoA